jgi:membrane-bound lytic murein transglycosylase D
VIVKEQMTFDQLSQALDVSKEEILYFNPQYRKNLIPSGGNSLCLPKNKIGVFLTNEQEIYAALKAQQGESQQVANVEEVKKVHTVKAGEKLSTIARKYGVTVADLRTWNYVGKKGVRAGKKLTVYVPVQKTEQSKIEIKPENKNENLAANSKKEDKQLADNNSDGVNYLTHKVKKGESVYSIAKKYGVTTKTIKALNGLDESGLKIGQVLKVREKA